MNIKQLLTFSNCKLLINAIITKGPAQTFYKLTSFFSSTNTYDDWQKKHTISSSELNQETSTVFSYNPLISILVPAYHTKERFIDELYDSLCKQSYSNWQLVIADANIDSPIHRKKLLDLAATDKRILHISLSSNLGISENTNAALHEATGDYIGLLDHDDLLTPNALYEVVKAINLASPDFIYSDEDSIDDSTGLFLKPHFKPDFNIELLRANNYICHFSVIKRSLLNQVGEFRPAFNGAQDYDLFLRCCEKANLVYHIPKILYHWRSHTDSTASNPKSKMYAYEAGKHALEEHLERIGRNGIVNITNNLGFYRIQYEIPASPLISILIWDECDYKSTSHCIDNLRKHTSYTNYELIIATENTKSKHYCIFEKYNNISFIDINTITLKTPGAVYNHLSSFASGKHMIILNNKVKPINSTWIDELLMFSVQPNIGAVGAKILSKNNKIYHAGIMLGIGDNNIGYAHQGLSKNNPGYYNRANLAQNITCVSAKCMMFQTKIFHKVGGFDIRYTNQLYDIDICLKLRNANFSNIYTPYAEMETKLKLENPHKHKICENEDDLEHLTNTWGEILSITDPFYNPNLSHEQADFLLQ
ncbi:MAG: glycosyltransferase [Clostridiales bacterium]|nr:glycosyltransferase [Clostridiales bacterium]